LWSSSALVVQHLPLGKGFIGIGANLLSAIGQALPQ
jgi:hypothetical protein